MSTRFVSVDRNTPMLFPPDLRDWVKPDDPVHLVLALVEALPDGVFRVNQRGTGSAQYPPSMMLALLIFCYSKGIFSSRRIEEATYENVSVRFLTGDTHPDHDTIASFRKNNKEAIAQCFVRALVYARETGLLRLGAISVDGTQIRANANKARNVRYGDLDAVETYLAGQVDALLAKAETADGAADDGDRLPPALTAAHALRAKVRQARETIEARELEKREHQRACQRRHRKRRRAAAGGDEKPAPAREPRNERPPTPKPHASANLTDMDSRLMRRDKTSGLEQSYNAQAVADADGSQLILAARVTNAIADHYELLPGVQSVPAELNGFTTVLADSGYANEDHVEYLEAHGKDVYVSVRAEHHMRHPKLPPSENPRPLSNQAKTPFGQRMREKLADPAGKQLYKRRRQSIESAFGIVKHVLGFRQFHLRGLANVDLEWKLVTLAYNIKMIWSMNRREGKPTPSPKRRSPGRPITNRPWIALTCP